MKCYPSDNNVVLMIVGYAFLLVGVILLFVCIPGWAWVALLGLVFLIAGYLLLKISRAWR